jgi:hypothetical protein
VLIINILPKGVFLYHCHHAIFHAKRLFKMGMALWCIESIFICNGLFLDLLNHLKSPPYNKKMMIFIINSLYECYKKIINS